MIPTINSLPDELLVTVIESAVFEAISIDRETCSECARIPNNSLVKTLSLVSHRFCRIAQPYLFYAPRARHDGSDLSYPLNPLAKLRDTLESRKALCSRIRVLTIHLTRYTAHEDLEAAEHILRRLARPSCLTLEAGDDWGHPSQSRSLKMAVIVAATQCSTSVRHVHIAGQSASISQLFESKWNSLARLDLRHIGIIPSLKGKTVEFGSASFTTLSVRETNFLSSSLERIVRWPRKLEHFAFIKLQGSTSALDWNNILLPILKHHSSTLRTIDIRCGIDRSNGEPLFDARLFPCLTHLRLRCIKNINVLGPSVTHFTWDLPRANSYSSTGQIIPDDEENWSQFGERHEARLRDIATAAVAQDAALRTIHIEFHPGNDGREGPNPWNHYNTFSAWYPWELMERVRDEVLRPSGRELTYSRPPFETKTAWQRDFSAAVKQRENFLKRKIAEIQARERERRARGL
ncbi:hypothetical protein PMIN06_009757 [Paraphaeosphaeria minitans]